MTEYHQETNPTHRVSVIIDDDKNTRLHYAAASGVEEEVLKSLEAEQKIDPENYLGWTPLMIACKKGHTNIVNLLLQYRADTTRKNKFGISVFLISVSSGNLEVVHLILQHLLCGGVSRQSMQYFLSPLSIAILFSHQHVLQYLIEQNFNLNTPTPITGITPLMFASAMENCEAFTLLLSRGADITITNCLGVTAHEITQNRNRKDVKVTEGNHRPPPMTLTKSPHIHQQPQQHQQIPYIVISPQPTFFQMPANQMVSPHLRKSSNTLSPSPNYYFATPNVTPIPPVQYMTQPQVFFPPEFSPSYYAASPVPQIYNNSNDFLNARMNQNMYMSPVPQTNFT